MPEWYKKIKARLEQYEDGAITEDEALSLVLQISLAAVSEALILDSVEEVPNGS